MTRLVGQDGTRHRIPLFQQILPPNTTEIMKPFSQGSLLYTEEEGRGGSETDSLVGQRKTNAI